MLVITLGFSGVDVSDVFVGRSPHCEPVLSLISRVSSRFNCTHLAIKTMLSVTFFFFFFLNFYGVVPKRFLTLLGSLHKEVAKTTSGTLVYRFERQTVRKKVVLPSKDTVSST